MSAFVVLPQATQVPRVVGESIYSQGSPTSPGLAGADVSSWVTSAALATVAAVSIYRAMRGRNWSRVSLGPNGGCFYEYKFRAKPGAKYRYRFSTDVWTPEWGHYPNEEKGRLIRYGQLLNKGTVRLPMQEDDDNDGWGLLGAADDGAVGALLLDCDGTLAETERDGHRVAFNKAFAEKGFDVEWDADLYGELLTTGGGKERMTRYFKEVNPDAWTFADEPAPDNALIMELHELKTQIFMDIVKSGELPLREGIKELISKADSAGWQLAVCSTSNEASVRAVVETMLPEFADKIKVFAGDVVAAKKPDPAIYKLAAQDLGVAPMRCVVVEDTGIGAQAGAAASMKVVVTKSVYSAKEFFGDADVVVENASELDFQKDIVSLLPVLELA
ncbi:CBBY [Symbiodinium pilosum]|uniref:CBBY protein n=1 Tax=Symbiodinium pilosum TaxID=2952 RepID=A0A812Y332_SYMPI|nr:CBBY [Symbiodinium pilosum]